MTAAFESISQMGLCMAFVTCSELPVFGYNLLNPRCKSWPPCSEPCEPKRKMALHINHQSTWNKELGMMEWTHLTHSFKNCFWQQSSSCHSDNQAGSLLVCRRNREGLVNKGTCSDLLQAARTRGPHPILPSFRESCPDHSYAIQASKALGSSPQKEKVPHSQGPLHR